MNKKGKEEEYSEEENYNYQYEDQQPFVPNQQYPPGYYNQPYYYPYPQYYGGMARTEESDSEYKLKGSGKKKLILDYIEHKTRRSVTFSKRKKGIMKKAYELNVLTGCEVLLLVASESGHVYTFATPKLKPIITEHEGLIQQCLSGMDEDPGTYNYDRDNNSNFP